MGQTLKAIGQMKRHQDSKWSENYALGAISVGEGSHPKLSYK